MVLRIARNSVWLVAGLACTTAAWAQPEDRRWGRPEATIYRDANYSGPAVAISQEQSDLGLAWRVNSIRIQSGRWEFCEKTRFRGTCRTYEQDMPSLNMLLRGLKFQSVRPLGGGGGGGGWPGPNPGNPGNGGPSLRGMSSQYFTQPAQYGQRVLACQTGSATANCAKRTADQFCKSMGWTASASQTMETVNRREYLADVLCSRTGY